MKKISDKNYSIWFWIFALPVSLFLLPGAAPAQELKECLTCHEDQNLTKTDSAGNVHSLYVDEAIFRLSSHGSMNYTCVDCHEQATAPTHPAAGIPDVSCEGCHEEQAKIYAGGIHQISTQPETPNGPKCYDCHTKHYVFESKDPRSSVNPDNLAATCGTCHEQELQGPGLLSSLSYSRLKDHGKLTLAGEFDFKRCLNCHFEIAKHGNPKISTPSCVACHPTGTSHEGTMADRFHKKPLLQGNALNFALELVFGLAIVTGAFALMSAAGKKYTQSKTDHKK